MTYKEVMVLDQLSSESYLYIAEKAVRYALISVAFTYDRMDKKDIIKRIYNITKGKIAEGIFYDYCEKNQVNLDSSPCTTPFWMPDLRDFLYLGGEWDIKNNFFYCGDSDITSFDITRLPALVPNKYSNDQWSKRDEHYIETSRFAAFLFTFMRLIPDKKYFFDIKISERQMRFLNEVALKYRQSPYGNMPFIESWFYTQLSIYGSDKYISMAYYPEMYITGCANARYWSLFKNTAADSLYNYYKYTDDDSLWYAPSSGVLRFLNGKMVTTIQNMTCPMAYLPSFQSVIKKHTR